MGCGQSKAKPQAGGGAFPAPLPPPMQDNMNEILNRWRHGEVNLLQRRFRQARAQAVKNTITSKILNLAAAASAAAAPASNSGTATSAPSSANNDASLLGEDGSASPASGDTETETSDAKKQRDRAASGAQGGGGGAGGSGDVGGSARAGLDMAAFWRVFPAVQGLPSDVQRSAYRLFDCVGRGSLDFRNFCRALALCCRGSREERLRFLFDLFSAPSQPKHYGTGADGGPRDAAPFRPGAPAVYVSETELTALKKHLGLSSGDADHAPFQGMSASASEGRPASSALLLIEYFEWAKAYVSDEALDRALRPFYLLPSPQQEKDKVLAQLTKHTTEEGQWMYLVAASWWRYWCIYASISREDLQRIPEASALGLGYTQDSERSAPPDDSVALAGPRRIGADVEGGNGHGIPFGLAREEGFQGTQQDEVGSGVEALGAKERAVPTMLARRPHEIDNSSLQGGAEWEVAPDLELGAQYVLLPKPIWDVMMDWYGGGPVFCRRVVKVSVPTERIASVAPAITIKKGGRTVDSSAGDVRDGDTSHADNILVIDLYPLALHVSQCDLSGRPSGRERLVLTSHHVTVNDMLSEVLQISRIQRPFSGLSGPPGAPVPSADEDNGSGEATGTREREGGDGHQYQGRGGEQAAGEQTAGYQTAGCQAQGGGADKPRALERTQSVRLWVLETIPNGLIDMPHTVTSRPKLGLVGGGGVGGVNQNQQAAGVKRWKLVTAEEEGMTLSALGFIGGEKVMLETQITDGSTDVSWPRHRYIEEPNFRDFREGDRLDAMDYQGRWFSGQVVAVVEAVPKNISKIVDSEGPVGRKRSKSRSRPQQQDQDRHRLERIEAPESISSRVAPAAGGSGGNSGMITKASRSRSSTSSSKSGSALKNRGSSGEVDAPEGSSAAVGSRKRMRIRVSFDRFASQWDEWYDSKSVKLAPEASHTAPAVVVQTIKKPESTGNNKQDSSGSINNSVHTNDGHGGHAAINNNKPREEPAVSAAEPREAEGEAQEEASPTLPSTKPGASSASSSNPARGGGGAYPPPVGRFPGDASSGNSWNTRLNLNTTFGPPRPNAAVPSGNADGISNYGGVALNRRSNTPGKPPIPGACGLVNVGNTCYLNSAIQCLSHTPLLRAYLLSDMWEAEVNKYNPLGTQGKLVEDFASLLKSLWSQEYLCFFPSKFKRGLIKYKQQFSGNEQQDSQEFLAVMLDALHEDVNRVIEKPYQPQTDEAESNRSDQELADEAWDGHVQRNRSVIVDLFQGQLKMECRCPVCDKKSVTFDPFMYLSVPIPTRNEKMVRLILLPRIRCRDIYVSKAGSGGGGAGAGDTSGADGEVVEFSNPRQLVPVQYGMMLPRMGEVMDLKRELSELCGVAPSFLVIATVSQHNLRILPSKEPLTNVREDDSVLAYVVGGATLYERSHTTRGQPMAEPPAETAPSNGRPGTDVAQVGAVVGVSNGEGGEVSTKGQGKDNSNNIDKGTGNDRSHGQGQAVGGSSTGVESGGDRGDAAADTGVEEDELTDLDDDRPRVPDSKVDRRSPDERCMEHFPSHFKDLENGWRLDALDKEGGWYPSTIIEVIEVSKSSDKRERQIRVHFDNFMSKWDEFYGEHEWKEGKLAPLYSKTQPDERLLDIPVVHRKMYKVLVSSTHLSNESVLHGGIPRANGISTGEGQRRSDGRDGRDQAAPLLYTTAKDLFGLPFVVRCPPDRSARYLWRLVVQQASRFVAGSSGSTKFRPARSRDRMAKAAAGASGRRANVTAAWVARAAAGKVSGMTDEKLLELLPFTVKLVLRNSPLLDTVSTDLLPDRWRAVSSLICTKLILALEWKDSSRDYLNVENSMFDHPSYLELETNAQSAQSGLTLEQCLDAYTREETLGEEDSWFCSGCRAHRRGVMKIDLWKMPDVLVMHMKRFQCSARWREKIRTLVVFPHSGLDMSGFVSSNSAHRNQVGGGQGGMVYDLFGVVNHIGGMTGGHYTAYCRSSPCSKDGVEEVTGWGLEHPWLHFDDEFVEEIAPDKIVSEAAYVLFYRRRRLTPSNVINMTI